MGAFGQPSVLSRAFSNARSRSRSGSRVWFRAASRRTAAGLGIVWALSAGEAHAYVRYKSKTGNPYAWREGCVWMLVYPHGFTDMTPQEVYAAERAAQATWSHDEQSGTYLEIVDTDVPEEVEPPLPQYDLTNTTIFHSDRWCRLGAASDGTDCYAAEALAITSVWTTSDGHIYDADIEVNAVNFRWADLGPASKTGFQDLQNTLTHETGHLLGLDHTCYNPSDSPVAPKDNNGQSIPLCSGLPFNDPLRMTTMFPSATPGDLGKRVLSPDEVQAVSEIYPIAESAAHACIPPETATGPKSGSGGCAVVRGENPSVGPIGLALGLGLAWITRRRRARR